MEYKNRNPKIFVISGKSKSGKNLVGDMITRYYSTKKSIQISYAYHLKDYLIRMNLWDNNEKTKPRDLLQSIGIDLLKNKIDPYFLINRVHQDIQVFSHFYDIIIITDARLLEEIEMPKREFQNVVTIRIVNNNENGLTEKQKEHITETALDSYTKFDYILHNDYDYDKLEYSLETILKEVDTNEEK